MSRARSGAMEPVTAAGAQLSLGDLYSFVPFNVTFPDEEAAERLRNSSRQQEAPGRSVAGISIAISITALYSVICVVGLVGNILVMYGVVR